MRRGEAGSALIEALVATAIVAGVLGVMFETLAGAGARHGEIAARRTALMIARSRLASVGGDITITPGEVEGVEGNFSWRVRIEPLGVQSLAISRAGSPDLVSVAVRRAAGGPDLIELTTLRLAPAP